MDATRPTATLGGHEKGQSAVEVALWACGAAVVIAVAGYVIVWSRQGGGTPELSGAEQAYVQSVATQQAQSFIRAVAEQATQNAEGPPPASTEIEAADAVSVPTVAPAPVSAPTQPKPAAPPPSVPATAPPRVVAPAPTLPPLPPPTATPPPLPTAVPFDARYLDHIQCGATVYACTGNARGIDVTFGCQENAPGQLSCQGETEYGEYVEFYCEPDPNWYGQEYERWFCS